MILLQGDSGTVQEFSRSARIGFDEEAQRFLKLDDTGSLYRVSGTRTAFGEQLTIFGSGSEIQFGSDSTLQHGSKRKASYFCELHLMQFHKHASLESLLNFLSGCSSGPYDVDVRGPEETNRRFLAVCPNALEAHTHYNITRVNIASDEFVLFKGGSIVVGDITPKLAVNVLFRFVEDAAAHQKDQKVKKLLAMRRNGD